MLKENPGVEEEEGVGIGVRGAWRIDVDYSRNWRKTHYGLWNRGDEMMLNSLTGTPSCMVSGVMFRGLDLILSIRGNCWILLHWKGNLGGVEGLLIVLTSPQVCDLIMKTNFHSEKAGGTIYKLPSHPLTCQSSAMILWGCYIVKRRKRGSKWSQLVSIQTQTGNIHPPPFPTQTTAILGSLKICLWQMLTLCLQRNRRYDSVL